MVVRAAVPRVGLTPASIERWRDRWSGLPVVVMASGPSLTAADVDVVYSSMFRNIVTNTTFRMAPWADVLFFHDAPWWAHYKGEVMSTLHPDSEIVTPAAVTDERVTQLQRPHFNAMYNSGAGAIALAILAGAKRVILLGCDAKPAADGRKHWHEKHPAGLGDAKSLPSFVGKFTRVAALAQKVGVEVVNASRDTALTCFPRVELEEALRC